MKKIKLNVVTILGVSLLGIMGIASAGGYISIYTSLSNISLKDIGVKCMPPDESHLQYKDLGAPTNGFASIQVSDVPCNKGDHMALVSKDPYDQSNYVQHCPVFNGTNPQYPPINDNTSYEFSFETDENGTVTCQADYLPT